MEKRFISFMFFSFFFLRLDAHEDSSHDSPHSIEIVNQGKTIEERWANFEDEIAWFLQYRNPFTKLGHSNEKLNEEDSQNNYLIEKWNRKQEYFVQSLSQADEAFFEFRRKVAEALSLESGEGRYAQSLSAQAELDLTNLYIEFMEGRLFPKDWKESYEKYKKSSSIKDSPREKNIK